MFIAVLSLKVASTDEGRDRSKWIFKISVVGEMHYDELNMCNEASQEQEPCQDGVDLSKRFQSQQTTVLS